MSMILKQMLNRIKQFEIHRGDGEPPPTGL